MLIQCSDGHHHVYDMSRTTMLTLRIGSHLEHPCTGRAALDDSWRPRVSTPTATTAGRDLAAAATAAAAAAAGTSGRPAAANDDGFIEAVQGIVARRPFLSEVTVQTLLWYGGATLNSSAPRATSGHLCIIGHPPHLHAPPGHHCSGKASGHAHNLLHTPAHPYRQACATPWPLVACALVTKHRVTALPFQASIQPMLKVQHHLRHIA